MPQGIALHRRPAGRARRGRHLLQRPATSSSAATAATSSRAAAATTSSTATSGSNVRSACSRPTIPTHTGAPIATAQQHDDARQPTCSPGTINPGQLAIVRDDQDRRRRRGDIDTAVYSGRRWRIRLRRRRRRQAQVTHTVEDALDGIRQAAQHRARRSSPTAALDIIVGTAGNDTLNGTGRQRPDRWASAATTR